MQVLVGAREVNTTDREVKQFGLAFARFSLIAKQRASNRGPSAGSGIDRDRDPVIDVVGPKPIRAAPTHMRDGGEGLPASGGTGEWCSRRE